MFGNRASKYTGVPLNAQGHTDQVLSVSVSSDGQYLASGSADCSVKIWDTRAKHACIKTFFNAHKEAVTSVSFRMGSHQLFTASTDRTIRIYNVDQMAYVETLYGHTSDVTAIDSLYRDRCLSASRDKTIRLWKVVEETQLMFRASPFIQSVDALSMLNEEQFVTGGQDGSVCAWINTKKKPTSVVSQAHGGEWITSVGAQKFTDVCFSGSCDGFLNLYCLESSGIRTNKLNQLHRIPVTGYINGMVSDARDGRFVALAMGQEHRLGRWNKIQPARNGIQLISLAGVDQQKYFAQEKKDEEERPEGEKDDEEEEDQDVDMDDDEEEEEEAKAAPAPKKRAVATKKVTSVKKAAARR
jgi:ribosomal RNA-processing protein 9